MHFLSTSQRVSIPEQIGCIMALHRDTCLEPTRVHDASLRRIICLKVVPIALVCDNPMTSEIGSHIGARGGLYCWKCRVRGKDDFKTSDEGYHSLLYHGRARTTDETIEQLLQQAVVQVCGSKSELNDLRARSGVKGPSLSNRQLEELQNQSNRQCPEIAWRVKASTLA